MRANRRIISLLTLSLCASCKCGEEGGPTGPEDVKALFEKLFASLPKSKIDRPADALPPDLSIIATSPDPEAWRAWAVAQPFAQAMMKTPLFEDLRISRAYLALEGLRQQAARASAFVGKREDLGALWRGPTAAGIAFRDGEQPDALVLVKKIDPAVRELVRFGAAFALAAKPEKGETQLQHKKVEELDFYTVERRNESVSFVLFRDLLVAGTDATLVERAARLAAGDPQEGDRPATKSELGAVLPAADAAGIHLAVSAAAHEVAKLAGVKALGVSLVADAAAPVLIRRSGGAEPGPDALALFRYAPAGTFLAIADGAKPSEELLGAIGADETLRDRLEAGTALIAGSGTSLVALRHKNAKDALEPVVRKLLGEMTGKEIERLVLEDQNGALILQSGDGAAAALTNDALLFAFSPEPLRAAIASGAGKAPSIADRRGVELGGIAGAGVFVDLAHAGRFLKDRYRTWLRSAEASAVLDPTFEALIGGGAYFARLEKGEGALRAIP
jgi:hypothetical protein